MSQTDFNDEEVIMKCIKQGSLLAREYTDKKYHSKHIIMSILSKNPHAFAFLSKEERANFEYAKHAISTEPAMITECSNELKDNYELASIAVAGNGLGFKYISHRLQNIKHFSILAVNACPWILRSLPYIFQNDEEIIKMAVSKDGMVVKEYHSREIAILAIKNEALALRNVSNDFANDIEIVMLAVSKDGCALNFASNRLKDNDDIVNTAFQQNPKSLKYASERLRNLKIEKSII